MDLYKEILCNAIRSENIQISFVNFNLDPLDIVNLESYKALEKIKTIIQDDSIDDVDCFMKIEKIICMFEKLGSNGGIRHDY